MSCASCSPTHQQQPAAASSGSGISKRTRACRNNAALPDPTPASPLPVSPPLLPCRYADLQRTVDLQQGQCELRWQYLAASVGWPPGLISKARCCFSLKRASVHGGPECTGVGKSRSFLCSVEWRVALLLGPHTPAHPPLPLLCTGT